MVRQAQSAVHQASRKKCSIDPGVDIVIEALGFQSAAQLPQFRDYILRAFRNGKSVVTSDKAVLARYGKEIWAAAKSYGQQLRFEACVGGGIPVIRSLSESFAVEAARSGLRHRQRHLQLYSLADGEER